MSLVAFDCEPALISSNLDAFFSACSRAFSAFRLDSSEALSTPLTPVAADRLSATGSPFSCSFGSLFNLLASFRASFESLPSLLCPLVAAFPKTLASLSLGEYSFPSWPARGALANLFSLFASLLSSFEGLLPRSSPLSTAILDPSSRLLFFELFVRSSLSVNAALVGACVIAE